jgi:hypothetical protein
MARAVAQWAKAPGIHCYVAGSIPAITPGYCYDIKKTIKKFSHLFYNNR